MKLSTIFHEAQAIITDGTRHYSCNAIEHAIMRHADSVFGMERVKPYITTDEARALRRLAAKVYREIAWASPSPAYSGRPYWWESDYPHNSARIVMLKLAEQSAQRMEASNDQAN